MELNKKLPFLQHDKTTLLPRYTSDGAPLEAEKLLDIPSADRSESQKTDDKTGFQGDSQRELDISLESTLGSIHTESDARQTKPPDAAYPPRKPQLEPDQTQNENRVHIPKYDWPPLTYWAFVIIFILLWATLREIYSDAICCNDFIATWIVAVPPAIVIGGTQLPIRDQVKRSWPRMNARKQNVIAFIISVAVSTVCAMFFENEPAERCRGVVCELA